MTERALGWVMVGSVRILEQTKNKAKVPIKPRAGPQRLDGQVFGFSAASSEEAAKGLKTVVTWTLLPCLGALSCG